jgi:hypothetical protein
LSRYAAHFFQNYNFVAKLHGKFGANVVERNGIFSPPRTSGC